MEMENQKVGIQNPQIQIANALFELTPNHEYK